MRSASSPFKHLMQGLYYPAVLGTGIVLLMFQIASEPSLLTLLGDISVYFALLFTAFFSLSFLIIEETPNELYGLGAFAVDLGEVIFVFLSYFFLGLFDSNTSGP